MLILSKWTFCTLVFCVLLHFLTRFSNYNKQRFNDKMFLANVSSHIFLFPIVICNQPKNNILIKWFFLSMTHLTVYSFWLQFNWLPKLITMLLRSFLPSQIALQATMLNLASQIVRPMLGELDNYHVIRLYLFLHITVI